jgi:ABC-type glycerol-3-phosphate transport system substrate-binding protein
MDPQIGAAGARQDGPEPRPVIKSFDQKLGAGMSGGQWKRACSNTGTGATHVKSFHCKLSGEALENMDRQINEWLDAHPEVEVKFVSTNVGEWIGKIKEDNLIVSIWV